MPYSNAYYNYYNTMVPSSNPYLYNGYQCPPYKTCIPRTPTRRVPYPAPVVCPMTGQPCGGPRACQGACGCVPGMGCFQNWAGQPISNV